MNQLIVTQDITMSSLELSQLLALRHDNVRQAANNLKDHAVISFTETSVKGAGRPKIVMHFDKRNSIIMAAKLNDKFMCAVIDRWLELESKQQFKIPKTLGEALQLAADQAKQLELAAPKIAFVDNLVNRNNLMTATQVGQKHKLSAVKLNKVLSELKVYNGAVKRAKVFQQWFIDKGFGEMKKTEQGYDQPLFTNAGEIWVNEKLINEGVV
jgi:phage antirepressor YoqD-like protein